MIEKMTPRRLSSVDSSHTEPSEFQAGAEAVLVNLRTEASRLFAASPGGISRATDLQGLLGVRMSLAWQFFRLGTATDPFAALAHIPKKESMARVLKAAQAAGFHSERVRGVRRAYSDFEEFVARHAGDRETFEAMVAPLEHSSTPDVDRKIRKAGFLSNAKLWGVQADLLYRACVCVPRPEEVGVLDAVMIRGWCGLRALRDVGAIPLNHRSVVVEKHNQISELHGPDPWILGEFCSEPLPLIETVQGGGRWEDNLRLAGVGQTASVDVFLGAPVSGVRSDEGEFAVGAMVIVPAKQLYLDLLVPRGCSLPNTIRCECFGHIHEVGLAMGRQAEHALPWKDLQGESVTSIEALHDRMIPRCPQMLHHVLARLGWEDIDFDIYRCRHQYPMLHTAISLQVEELFEDQSGSRLTDD